MKQRILGAVVATLLMTFGLNCVADVATASSQTMPANNMVSSSEGGGSGSVKRAQEGLGKVNPDGESGPGLEESIKKIMGAVFFILGIAAVAVIVLGGVTYVTSQGDPGKVKKGRDTIIYGIVGLVVALLAFAIVTFVLNALKG